jgi:hypothetical protein
LNILQTKSKLKIKKMMLIVYTQIRKQFQIKSMKFILLIVSIVLFSMDSIVIAADQPNRYEGVYCAGIGDTDYLRLIDESFAFLYPNPVVPNLSMVYKPDWDTFEEGAGWGAWWIQNSYGFSYSVTPFLPEPWFSLLQNSWDLFWINQGDGTRKGCFGEPTSFLHELVAPDGSLGDVASPDWIIYKQGDGNIKIHDWYYEGTAAGVVIQAEILLASRDMKAINYYLPKMERACNFIEKTRDPNNNLFLVGPAANLLAPSFGGVKLPDGSFGKAYLAGLTVTYLAALERMVELYKLIKNNEKLDRFHHLAKITRASIPLLLTSEGYFVKSIEPNGKKHGVLGQDKFGYLEGVTNVDAVALRVADDKIAKSIYTRINSFPAIRPFDFLLTNAPGLDDTYWSWGKTSGPGMEGFHQFGDWVNGGVWGTVESRAILMYYRLGKFNDIFRSASRAMKWAKDFRMDAPWSQQGENINNPWSDSGQMKVRGVSVMIDNFGIPAATIRGLFDYEYRHDRLLIRPRIPGTIKEYAQNWPVRFGNKKIFLTCINRGPNIKSVKINGKEIKITNSEQLELFYDHLPEEAHVILTTEGTGVEGVLSMDYPRKPALIEETVKEPQIFEMVPDTLKESFEVLQKMKNLLNQHPEAQFDKSFIEMAIQSIETFGKRIALDPGSGYFRPITSHRKDGINDFYKQAALSMFNGFEKRMEKYEHSDNKKEKEIALLYRQAKK